MHLRYLTKFMCWQTSKSIVRELNCLSPEIAIAKTSQWAQCLFDFC